MQSKAKAVADCIVQVHEGELVDVGRESGVDEESVHVTKKHGCPPLKSGTVSENAGRLKWQRCRCGLNDLKEACLGGVKSRGAVLEGANGFG